MRAVGVISGVNTPFRRAKGGSAYVASINSSLYVFLFPASPTESTEAFIELAG